MADLKTRKKQIELVIDEEAFYFEITDARTKGFRKFSQDTLASMQKLTDAAKGEPNELEEKITAINAELGKIFDYLMGEGTYKKVYAKAPSVFSMIDLLTDVLDAINTDLITMDKAEQNRKDKLMQKYIKKTSKK